MTTRKTYYLTEGLTEISDAQLAYIKPLMVCRSGVQYNLTDLDALLVNGSNFYEYSPSLGTLYFSVPFNQNETINVIYETNP